MDKNFEKFNYRREANYHAILEYLFSHQNPKDQSLRKIEKATGIPKSTVAEIISEKGNLRSYPSEHWEKIAKENLKHWDRIKDKIKPLSKKGDVQYYGYRDSQFKDFCNYAMKHGYLVERLEKGLSVIKVNPESTFKTFKGDIGGIEHNPYAEDYWDDLEQPDKISVRKLAKLDRKLRLIKKFKIPSEITVEDTYENPDNHELVEKHVEQQEIKEQIEFILQEDSVPVQVDTIFELMKSPYTSNEEAGKMLFEEWKRINDDKDGSIFHAILDEFLSQY